MELVVKGRGARITSAVREAAEQKLAKLERIDPRVVRVEVVILEERNPRVQGRERVKAVALTARRSFRASGVGDDVPSALDQVVDRLDRQLTRYRARFRARLWGRANRLKSAHIARTAEGVPPSD